MTIPDSDFVEFRAHELGRLLYTCTAGEMVEIALEDADGNPLGSTYRLYVAQFLERGRKPDRVKIIGRLSRRSSPPSSAS